MSFNTKQTNCIHIQTNTSYETKENLLITFEKIYSLGVISHVIQNEIEKDIYESNPFNLSKIGESIYRAITQEKIMHSQKSLDKTMLFYLELLNTLLKNNKQIDGCNFFLSMCFSSTNKYHWKDIKEVFQFSLKVHQKAFEFIKKLLEAKNLDNDIEVDIFRILPHIANHPQLSSDEQIEIYSLGQKKIKDNCHTIRFLRDFVKLKHITNFLRNECHKKLLDDAKNKKLDDSYRNMIIEHLPFHPRYKEISDIVRMNSINFMKLEIYDKSESIKLRTYCVDSLNSVVRIEDSSEKLSQIKEKVINILESILFDTNIENKIRYNLAIGLYCRIYSNNKFFKPLIARLRPKYNKFFYSSETPKWVKKEILSGY